MFRNKVLLKVCVSPFFRDGERKSMSVERTFTEINKPAQLYKKCLELSEALAEDLKEETLKVSFP
jgi:DNA polymerase kappa